MFAGDAKLGLPYGSTPRLVLAWMTTEAVKTKNPQLTLGGSFTNFLHEVGIIRAGGHASGGKRGVRTYAQRQTMALFNAIVSWNYADDRGYRRNNIPIASEYNSAWDPLRADQETLWTSTVTMGDAFFATRDRVQSLSGERRRTEPAIGRASDDLESCLRADRAAAFA